MNLNLQSSITKPLLIILLLTAVAYYTWQEVKVIQAVGTLIVNFENTPLFNINNFLPGDSADKTLTIENNQTDPVLIGLRAIKTDETPPIPGLSQVLEVVIEEIGGSILYGAGSPTGPQTLADLFAIAGGISLTTVNPSDTVEYRMHVTMPTSVGNEYQGAGVVFDLIIMADQAPLILPAECQHLSGMITEIIMGTDDNDRIRGTSASELIIGKAGHDRIRGGGGHDCIVGGPGNDRLNGGTGEDVILGGAGHDRIDGHSDNDILYGGPDNDRIKGKHGDDTAYGGPGHDRIQGYSGNDLIYGEQGNDNLRGGSGNDLLEGGLGIDKANGNSGFDTCDAETENNCEV